MTALQLGSVWQDRRAPYRGRRGRVVAFEYQVSVTLDPEPGSCPCPLKQRRTTIGWWRFLVAWDPVHGTEDQ